MDISNLMHDVQQEDGGYQNEYQEEEDFEDNLDDEHSAIKPYQQIDPEYSEIEKDLRHIQEMVGKTMKEGSLSMSPEDEYVETESRTRNHLEEAEKTNQTPIQCKDSP